MQPTHRARFCATFTRNARNIRNVRDARNATNCKVTMANNSAYVPTVRALLSYLDGTEYTSANDFDRERTHRLTPEDIDGS